MIRQLAIFSLFKGINQTRTAMWTTRY